MKKIRLLPIALATAMMLTFVSPVYATEAKDSTKTEESTSAAMTATDVDGLISAIDMEDPDRSAVQEAKEAYESLPMAEQIEVENYDQLMDAETQLGLVEESSNTNQEDTSTQKNGTSYTIRFSSYMPQATLSIRFVTDEDGDGKMDAPTISITSPTNEIYEIGEKDRTLQTEECLIDILRADAYIQLDVSSASEGSWTFKTSNRVIFESSDYKGNEEAASFTAETDTVDTKEETESSDSKRGGTNPLILLVFAAGIIAVFMIIKKMPTKSKESGKDTKGKAEKSMDTADDDNDSTLSDEEMIRKIKEEWERESQSGLYRDYEDPAKEQSFADDERLSQTVEEIADESDIDDLDDGFFTGARFKR